MHAWNAVTQSHPDSVFCLGDYFSIFVEKFEVSKEAWLGIDLGVEKCA